MKVPHAKSILNFDEDTALELVSYLVIFLYSMKISILVWHYYTFDTMYRQEKKRTLLH